MPPPPRRLWDSCVVLDYLCGAKRAETCERILREARAGKLEIMVSALATVEVAYLQGHSDADSESKIREFFARSYIVVAAVAVPVTIVARRIIRENRPGLRSADAIHAATALQWHVPVLETFDPDLLKLDGKISNPGSPPLVIREPRFEGTIPMELPP